jgi:hypothetical protein
MMKRVCPFDVDLLAFDATDHVLVRVARRCST